MSNAYQSWNDLGTESASDLGFGENSSPPSDPFARRAESAASVAFEPAPEIDSEQPLAVPPSFVRRYRRAIHRIAIAGAIVMVLVLAGLAFRHYVFAPWQEEVRLETRARTTGTALVKTRPLVITPGQRLSMSEMMTYLAVSGYLEQATPDSQSAFYIVSDSRTLEVFPGQQDAGSFDPLRIRYSPDGDVIQEIFRLAPVFAPLKRAVIPAVAMPPYARGPTGEVFVTVPRDYGYLARSGIIDLAVAIEDRHRGERYRRLLAVDLQGFARAALVNLRNRRVVEGASTIEMQLARMLSPDLLRVADKTLVRKAREIRAAQRLRLAFTDEEILEMWANRIPLGSVHGVGIQGFEAAAMAIFGRPLASLEPGAKVMLASMASSPASLNPATRNGQRSARIAQRYLSVVTLLEKRGVLDRSIARQAMDRIPISNSRLWHPVLTAHASTLLRTELSRCCSTDRQLSVQVSLDPGVQASIYTAVIGELERLGEPLQAAAVVLENPTGKLLAFVSNPVADGPNTIDYARARHQVGSLMKPLVLQYLLSDGAVTAASTYLDEGVVELKVPQANQPWRVRNNGGFAAGREVTMYEGLARSLNTTFVQAAAPHGEELLAFINKQFEPPLPIVPSWILGTAEMSLIDVAAVYSQFTTGIVRPPHLIESARDETGREIRLRRTARTLFTDPRAAYITFRALEFAAHSPFGTSRRLGENADLVPFTLGAKTGTTSAGRDLWTVVITPRITMVVWFGSRNRSYLSGGASALRAAETALVNLARSRPELLKGSIPVPPGITERLVCIQTGKLAAAHCPTASWPFTIGSEPSEACGHS